jgi:pyruvate, water dikinase
MSEHNQPIDRLVHELRERAKELSCLYKIQELLGDPDQPVDEICQDIVEALPPGWQYPDACQAQIAYGEKTYITPGYQDTSWVQSADVTVQNEIVGQIRVCYTEERPPEDEGPFLKEERKLINTIAEQFGFYILHQQLRQVFQEQQKAEGGRKGEWGIILDLLKRTDPGLLMRISRKMINYLDWKGIKDAEQLLERFGPAYQRGSKSDSNRPYQQGTVDSILSASDEVFAIASRRISRDEILDNTQKWIKEERSGFLVNTLVNPSSSLSEISSAVERYHHLASQGIELTQSRDIWFRAAIIRRVLSDQPAFIEAAKRSLAIAELSSFMRHIIYPVGSHGKLGGKSAGLFLAAQILKQSNRQEELFPDIRIPKTWYITSDTIFYFMIYNNLEDIIEQRFKDLDQIRQEYTYIVHFFKSSRLPPEIVQGLSLALDDFGDVPLIIRSSSLLEDQAGLTFAGKYKSLFIANQGTKDERLAALTDAITEVYASLFSPDAIEYRIQHGLLDHHEEMGILIQTVVGKQVGDYYFPAFAGVAFSNNEFRWSRRIKREDGLIRIVPGLGTRAVDRLTDDYPALVSPGQPKLRVNATPDEIVRYSPQKIDVINLKTRTFETVEICALLKECGQDYPLISQILSRYEQGQIQPINALGVDFENSEFVVTFEDLFSRTPFLKQMRAILSILQETLDHPIDIEFAHDGENFYLLQCRAQSFSEDSTPSQIPRDIAPDKIIFLANRYVSNGHVPDVTHIVYVDPQKYSELSDYQTLVAIGRAIGRLNQILPKRQFILMGPGRWGSRGDIKLGVNVTYSDINNTAMLIEIARRNKDYIPEPSFGTHFFQDLVEASIYYLPLYPDDVGVIFNEKFLTKTRNLLADLLPDFADLANIIRLIDVPASTGNQVLRVLMNADFGEAIAILTEKNEKR